MDRGLGLKLHGHVCAGPSARPSSLGVPFLSFITKVAPSSGASEFLEAVNRFHSTTDGRMRPGVMVKGPSLKL